MPAVQWVVTAAGLFAATLGLCLLAIVAHDAARRRRWMVLGLLAAVLLAVTLAFVLQVSPQVRAG